MQFFLKKKKERPHILLRKQATGAGNSYSYKSYVFINTAADGHHTKYLEKGGEDLVLEKGGEDLVLKK